MKKDLTNIAHNLDTNYEVLEAYIEKYEEQYHEFLEFYGKEDNYSSMEEFAGIGTRFSEFEYNYLEELKLEEAERQMDYRRENDDE